MLGQGADIALLLSAKASSNCPAATRSSFSEREPKTMPFKVWMVARKLAFSAAKARTISRRSVGFEGKSSGRSGMNQHYRNHRK
jgi:hypothetical protein